tara:strand:+ start:125 stop:478 length:354 start_codon:yes stop_codon:yes gene_type:complete
VDISPELPVFNIVRLPTTAVQESRERARAAIHNSGGEFPMRRITISLAPANLKKSGPSYDLPVAVGILMSSGQLPEALDDSLPLGQLALFVIFVANFWHTPNPLRNKFGQSAYFLYL